MERITRKDIERAYDAGIIQIADMTQAEGCMGDIICKIGEYWFYFAGAEGENKTAAEYVREVPKEDIISEIHEAINSEPINGETYEDSTECLYYRSYISEQLDKLEDPNMLTCLLGIHFWTGDPSCRYYDLHVLIRAKDYDTIVDTYLSYVETPESEDNTFAEQVGLVLDTTGCPWSYFKGGEAIQTIRDLYI